MNRDTTKIKIIQYNVGRRYEATAQLLRHPEAATADVIAIQEPWTTEDHKATHNPVGGLFHAILPQSEKRPRVSLYVHRGIDIGKLRVRTYDSGDIVSVMIDADIPVAIHNIYNPHTDGSAPNQQYNGIPGNSVIPHMDEAIRDTHTYEQIVIGDFNLHHPWWTNRDLPRSKTNQTDCLIDTMRKSGLDQCLLAGTVTRPADRQGGMDSTIDLVWATQELRHRMEDCRTRPDLEADSDHIPIETSIRTDTPQQPEKTRRRYRDMDQGKLNRHIQEHLPTDTPLRTTQQIEARTAEIARTIDEAIANATPEVRIHRTYTKPGFCKAVIEKIKAARRARRRWQRLMDDESQEEYRKTMRQKKNAILQANRNDHRERVSEVDSPVSLWKLANWVKNRDKPKTAFTPDIVYQGRRITEWEQKADVFAATFFPAPPPAELDDIPRYTYPPYVPSPDITEEEVRQAIQGSAADRAPGPDQISNKVLKAAGEHLTQPLQKLFNACVQAEYCPKYFKHSTTIVIPKPGKTTYKEPKSYRPIALMNTIGKIMDSIVARRLQYYAEKYQLLPRNHTGGRKATSCEHALHLLVERIHAAWRTNKVASLLMLDVTGAFDNVSHERLLHNLRKRHIHPMIVGWLRSYLQGRTTEIRLQEGTSQPIDTNTGIPQGSPLSPILYLFYNADLLNIGGPEDLVTGYIDDTSVLVVGDTKRTNNTSLEAIHSRAEEWARKTGSVFAPQKYVLIHFTKNKTDRDEGASLILPGVTVQPSATAKLLGVTLDKRLTGIPHAERLHETAMTTIKGLQTITGSTWGISLQQGVQLYKAILLPKLAYASTVWYKSNPEYGSKTDATKINKILSSIQKEALRVVTGAWRNTALAALEIETNTTPIHLYLQQRNENALHRIRGSETYTVITQDRNVGTGKRKKTPLQLIEQQCIIRNPLTGQEREEIEPIITNLASPWWEPPDTNVASSKEGAIRLHRNAVRKAKRNAHHAIIYTDGSEIQGQVGTAAWCPGAGRGKSRYLGDNTRSTVYSAELVGIELALQIAQELEGCKRVTIFTDNQAAIQAITNPRITSGQYITQRAVAGINKARKMGITPTIQWIPSHIGIQGNEEVDLLAKEAAGWNQQDRTVQETLRARAYPSFTLRSAKKRHAKQETARVWGDEWQNGLHGREYYLYAPTPHRKYFDTHGSLKKALSAVITQMRTGKIGLNSYLHGIKAASAPTDRCRGCKRRRETLYHVLLECPSFGESRTRYWKGRPPHSLKEIFTDTEKSITAARQLLSLGLLVQFSRVKQGTLSEPSEATDTRQ
jgi:ribonuclease HI/exonuclease III